MRRLEHNQHGKRKAIEHTAKNLERLSFTEQITEIVNQQNKVINENTGTLDVIVDQLNRMADLLKDQSEHITALYEIIYKLAPEYEIIETMADSEEEEQKLLARYMNHNDAYLQEED